MNMTRNLKSVTADYYKDKSKLERVCEEDLDMRFYIYQDYGLQR